VVATGPFTVPLVDSVDPHRLTSPSNDSEWLLYGLTFDTPIRLDCRRRAGPGLAAAWSKDSSGRVWTLTLSDDARGFDGSPLSAPEILRIWADRQTIEQSFVIQSARALDERRISIVLERPQDSVPQLLADPAFSVAIDPAQCPAGLKIDLLPQRDPRDALDAGADLLVSRDPALVEYASTRPGLVGLPLPWTRTYVLLEPAGAPEDLVRLTSPAPTRQSMARDAVHADARAAEPPFWWNEPASCPAGREQSPVRRSSRVVYLGSDPVAGGLADRVVALAGPGAGLRTAALDADELTATLRSGAERAYILALPRNSLVPCRNAEDWPPGASIVPLVDTRATAIVRRGAPPLQVEWSGSLRVDQTSGSETSP
jgi:hypothetical protein